MGMIVATLLALLALASSASAARFTGGTSQPGGRKVAVLTTKEGPVGSASISWTARCGGGSTLHSRTTVTDFSRASKTAFAERFKGRSTIGGRKLKLRYTFAGKRRVRSAFLGTFRLSARYRPKHGRGRVTCRTGLVHWAARLPREGAGRR
jgi:hypothetical protein